MRCFQLSTLFLALFAVSASVSAQVLFTSELDSESGWTIVGDGDTAYEFGFDYTTLGIPKNLNNPSDSTTGLKMSANIVEPAEAAAISATPDGVTFSGSYRLEADFWLNYNTSGGTTEYIGGFVGYDPAGLAVNGIGLLGDSDGDSGSDYRIYSDGAQVAARDNIEAELIAAFPGGSTPPDQSNADLFDPVNVSATAPDGTLGFGWHTLILDVNGVSGMVEMTIDDTLIGTVDSSDDLSALEGGIALGFADLFPSISTKPDFSFGVFDNVTVTQVPEPNSLWLAVLGMVALATFRRRR